MAGALVASGQNAPTGGGALIGSPHGGCVTPFRRLEKMGMLNMVSRIKIASGIATAALAVGSLGIAVGPADAAGGQGNNSSSNRNFNPTVEKVNVRKILAEAQNINRRSTVKLMVDRNGTWRTLKVWNPSNARPRNFAETVTLQRVGNIKRYIVRVVDRNSRGRVKQVQDSDDRGSRGGAGRTNGGDNGGTGTNDGLLGGLGL